MLIRLFSVDVGWVACLGKSLVEAILYREMSSGNVKMSGYAKANAN